ETAAKKLSAHLFYRLLSRISQVTIPEDTGDFRLMSRKAVDALKRLPERNRYMKGLFAWVGMPTTVIEYDRARRRAGGRGEFRLCPRAGGDSPPCSVTGHSSCFWWLPPPAHCWR